LGKANWPIRFLFISPLTGDPVFRAAIEKLRAQNEELKHDLLLENKFSVRPGDPYAQALINRLQDEGDMLARKVGE